MNDTILVRKRSVVVQQQEGGEAHVGAEVFSKGGVILFGGITLVVGLWALICFVAGMCGNDGPLNLFRHWLSAVAGI